MNLKILSFILWCTVSTVRSCPANQTVNSICKCENSFNGINLDCGSTVVESDAQDPTRRTLQILRENQAQLGLIQQLSFQNGTLTNLYDGMFEGLFVKKLDLSNNQIENISSDAFRGLENIMQILILRNNSLKKLPRSSLVNIISLTQLDLSDNLIRDIMDDSDVMPNLPKMTDLNLANNRICNFHKDIFENLKNSLQTLNLGGNCFAKVPASSIRGFKQLLALHLHKNKIRQLEPLQFMNLPYLNLINLAQNQISDIHRQSFLNVPNLRFMYLSENNITSLESHQFQTFDNLELLDLTKNRIKSVPTLTFANMPRLAQLYLGDNDITTIESGAFANSSLVILLLSNNQLTSLSADMFNGLTYLQQFSLKNNKINGFASNTFYQMPSLVVLDISNNQLVILQAASFLAQLNLFLLDMSGNKLITVPYNAFNQRIVTVLLQENPLVCTERVHVLQNGVGVYLPDTVDQICGGVPKSTQQPHPAPNDGPSFIQGNAQGGQSIINIATSERPLVNSSNQVFRPLTTAVPNLNTFKNIIQAITQFPPITTRSAFAPNNVPLQPAVVPQQEPTDPRFEIIQSPGQSNVQPEGPQVPQVPQEPQSPQVPVGPLGPQNPQDPSGPQFQVPTNGQPGLPNNILLNVPHFPQNRTPFPHFGGVAKPSAAPQLQINENSFPGIIPRGPSNTDFFWTTPTTRGHSSEGNGPQPFTIPFLTQGPIVGPAFAIGPAFTLPNGFQPLTPVAIPGDSETLPPSIIIATIPPWTTPSKGQQLDTIRPYPEFFTQTVKYGNGESNNIRHSGDPGRSGINRTVTDLPYQVKTVPPKKNDEFGPNGNQDAAVGGDFNSNDPAAPAKNSATTTIAVCLTVVVVVMVAVFITLCVVRHKSNTKKSVSSASRTSAYVAAQAARMNYAASNYGTGAYIREPPPRPPRTGKAAANVNSGTLQPQNTQTWIYAPGTYTSASQYYK